MRHFDHVSVLKNNGLEFCLKMGGWHNYFSYELKCNKKLIFLCFSIQTRDKHDKVLERLESHIARPCQIMIILPNVRSHLMLRMMLVLHSCNG